MLNPIRLAIQSLTARRRADISLCRVFVQLVLGVSPADDILCGLLLAGKNLRPLAARVAFDEAAPLELTVALPHFGVLVRVVAAAAAHEVAAIRVR